MPLEEIQFEETKPLESQTPSPSPEPEQPAAAPAVVSAEPAMSVSDKKLADKMSREIARALGLSGRSRSVRV